MNRLEISYQKAYNMQSSIFIKVRDKLHKTYPFLHAHFNETIKVVELL